MREEMIKHLSDHIVGRLGQRPGHLDEVLGCFEAVRTRRCETLVAKGETCRHCYFVVKGCLQTATYDAGGAEHTLDLAFENEWRTLVGSFVNQQPARERLASVEPGELLAISYRNFRHLTDTVPAFERVYQEVLEASYVASVARVQTLMGMDALARVRWLLERHPRIFARLPNKLIASYLSVTPATLSRLKRKI